MGVDRSTEVHAHARGTTIEMQQHAGRSHNFSPSRGDMVYQHEKADRISDRLMQASEPTVGAEVARATRRDMRLSMNGQKLRKLCGDLLQDGKFRELQEKSRAKHKSVPLAWKGYEEVANRSRRKSSHTSSMYSDTTLVAKDFEPWTSEDRYAANITAGRKSKAHPAIETEDISKPNVAKTDDQVERYAPRSTKVMSEAYDAIVEATRGIQMVNISNQKSKEHGSSISIIADSPDSHLQPSQARNPRNRSAGMEERVHSATNAEDLESDSPELHSKVSSSSDEASSASDPSLDAYGKHSLEDLVAERLLDATLSSFPQGQSLHNDGGQQNARIGHASKQSTQEKGSNRTQSGPRRKRERDNGRDPGDGDEDDSSDDEEDKRKRKRGKVPSERKPHLGLRCPFYLRQPEKYRNVQACSNEGGFTDFSRLRSHLKRVHTQPLRCPRCFEKMKSPLECNDHLRQDPPCQTRTKPKSDQLTLEEWTKTEQIVRASVSVEIKWSRLFRALFPKDEKVPPCYDRSVFMSQVDDVLAIAINSVLRTEFPTMASSSLERVKQEILQRCKDRLQHRKMSSDEEVPRIPSVHYAAHPEQDDNAPSHSSRPNLASVNSQSLSISHDGRFSSNGYIEDTVDPTPNRAYQSASAIYEEKSSDRDSHHPSRRPRATIPSRIPLEMNREVGTSTDSSHTTQLSNPLHVPPSHRTSMTSYSMHQNFTLQPLSEIAESIHSQADPLENQEQQYETRHAHDNMELPTDRLTLFDWSQLDNFGFDPNLLPNEAENQRHNVSWSDWRT